MSSYDTTGTNSKRAQAASNFFATMREGDRAGIVTFTSSAITTCGLTDSQTGLLNGLKSIRSSGGTSFSAALSTALTVFDEDDTLPINKRIILLSDGEDSVPYAVLDKCKERNIVVYTIGLGSSSDSILETIATYTGGEFFKAYTADELLDIYSDIGITSDFDTTDTDGDGLYDAVEAAGIRLQNGKIIYDCDPTDYDSDDDGLLDGEEIDPTIRQFYAPGMPSDVAALQPYYFVKISDPNNEDTDGDGLLDGKAQYHNGKALAPTDPDPTNVTGEFNMWKTHIDEIESETKTAYGYSNDYYEPVQFEGEVKWNFIFPYLDSNLAEVIVSAFSSFGSVALDFRYDDEHIALHSDTTQWQSIGGYNDFYDWVFDTATSMNKLKLDFTLSSNNQDYVVWIWKGNYLNLGAGSEVGFYMQNGTLEYLEEEFELEHWMVSDELPMTLSLYKVAGNGLIYDTYYHWLPDENQWWITGFVPDVYDQWLSSKFGLDWGDTVTADELLQIASVDFSENPQMLIDLKEEFEGKDEAQYLIFDMKENTLWIAW